MNRSSNCPSHAISLQFSVIPAQAGVQRLARLEPSRSAEDVPWPSTWSNAVGRLHRRSLTTDWIPACAGMTEGATRSQMVPTFV